MDLMELYKQRYSGRAFDRRRPIPEEVLEKVLEAARLAPTGCNSQQWKVLVLESGEALKKVEECSECIYGAPVVLVFLYDKSHPDSKLEINRVDVGFCCCQSTGQLPLPRPPHCLSRWESFRGMRHWAPSIGTSC